jgi:hypothetical protein
MTTLTFKVVARVSAPCCVCGRNLRDDANADLQLARLAGARGCSPGDVRDAHKRTIAVVRTRDIDVLETSIGSKGSFWLVVGKGDGLVAASNVVIVQGTAENNCSPARGVA